MEIILLKTICCELSNIFAYAPMGRKETDRLLQYVTKQIVLKRNGICVCMCMGRTSTIKSIKVCWEIILHHSRNTLEAKELASALSLSECLAKQLLWYASALPELIRRILDLNEKMKDFGCSCCWEEGVPSHFCQDTSKFLRYHHFLIKRSSCSSSWDCDYSTTAHGIIFWSAYRQEDLNHKILLIFNKKVSFFRAWHLDRLQWYKLCMK